MQQSSFVDATVALRTSGDGVSEGGCGRVIGELKNWEGRSVGRGSRKNACMNGSTRVVVCNGVQKTGACLMCTKRSMRMY